jgi:cardiolipin synthase C
MRFRAILPFLLATLPTAFGCAAESEEDSTADAVSNKVLDDIGTPLGGAISSEVLTQNEDALEAKLAIIDGAQPGDQLDISYYIFSDDESGALYATRVVEAAKRGVKVRLMLDYLTNFGRYHYFKAMQDAAGGPQRLAIKFYNKPNARILQDVRFLVTPCPAPGKAISQCTAERRAGAQTPEAEAKAKLFLTGLYAKSASAMQASLGPTLVQFQAEQASGPAMSDKDKANAMKGVKLLFDAKIKHDFGAMMMVFFAGDKLKPLNTIWSALIPEAGGEHSNDWEHITDFSHQKLTLKTSANGEGEVVVGGRNVENSYHISELPPERADAWKKKYIFMDVDLHARFANTAKIKERFEKIWGFDEMVGTMGGDVESLTPVNLTLPRIENGAPAPGTSEPVLQPYTYEDITRTAARFKEYATYEGGKIKVTFASKAVQLAEAGQFPRFDAREDPNAQYYYFDNVPNPKGKRVFGAEMKFGKEKDNGKHIQELWNRAIADLCKNGDGKGGKVEIVFHNAYLSLPGRLNYELFERTRQLGQGSRKFECETGVSKVKILTNSRESTDLSIVNVYNEAWMKPTMEADNRKGGTFIDYREYKTNEVTAKNPISRSLHAKVMIFGDDVWVGSANADGRSEFMDANNGIFIRNAPNLSKKYREWLSSTIEPDLVSTEDPRDLRGRPIGEIADDNARFLSGFITAKGQSEEMAAIISGRIKSDTTQINQSASKCLPEFDKDCISSLDRLLQPF